MIVSLKDFLASGVIAQVPFGCDQRHLEASAGAPEATGGVSRKHRRPVIWKYGDVEFHFSRSNGGLEMVHMDRFSGVGGSPRGWGRLQVDPWIIREGLGRAEFLRALDSFGLAHVIRVEPALNQEVVVMASGVEVRFVAERDDLSGFAGLSCLTRRGSPAEPGAPVAPRFA
jgi:hypothetical protein